MREALRYQKGNPHPGARPGCFFLVTVNLRSAYGGTCSDSNVGRYGVDTAAIATYDLNHRSSWEHV